MNRRDSLKSLLAAALAGGLPLSLHAIAAGKRDRFGGWTGKKFKATGFFRVEKDTRWWLVTPEGNAFLSFGINHLYPDLFRQDYKRAAWQKRLGLENLDDWEKFAPALRRWFLTTCRDYGINTVGVHNSLSIVNRPGPELPANSLVKASQADYFCQCFRGGVNP